MHIHKCVYIIADLVQWIFFSNIIEVWPSTISLFGNMGSGCKMVYNKFFLVI